MNNMKINAKIIRCANAGENKTLKESLMKNFKEIKFEFMSPGTPQQNDVVERGFATHYSRMRVMMTHAGLHEISRLFYSPNAQQLQPNLKTL